LQTGARVGMHVLSKTLSDRYLRAANERIFAPLGLRARLVKTSALRVLVNHPDAMKAEPSKLKRFGRATGDVVLRLPIPFPVVRSVIRSMMDKVPEIDPRMTDPLARRLMTMHGYILPVEYGPAIPPLAKPDKILDKMNGFAVGRKRGKVDKQDRNADVRRKYLAGIPVTREGGMTRAGRDYLMLLRVSSGSASKLKDKVENDARREHRANEKLVWLVIINEADDAKIQGKEVMDNSSDSITFNDQELEESRERFIDESNGNDVESELEDYDPRSIEQKASGSNLKADAF